jgi:probable HAF family extracellular repeat protein
VPIRTRVAINSAGTIVGCSYAASGDSHAFIYYSGGPMTDLNSVPILDPDGSRWSGWTLVEAEGINDHGYIVGRARGPNGIELFALGP